MLVYIVDMMSTVLGNPVIFLAEPLCRGQMRWVTVYYTSTHGVRGNLTYGAHRLGCLSDWSRGHLNGSHELQHTQVAPWPAPSTCTQQYFFKSKVKGCLLNDIAKGEGIRQLCAP